MTTITGDLPNLLPADALSAADILIPPHMNNGLMMYMNDGIEQGSFLNAVLTNNLMDAFTYADDSNAMAMRNWARWLYNYAPSQSYGSVARVKEWRERGGLRGRAIQLMPFYVSDDYRGSDILASNAAGVPSYWEGKPTGWYYKKLGYHFNGPYPTEAVALAAFHSTNQRYP